MKIYGRMLTDFNQLDLNKRYSYADYLTWRFDEMVELIKGRVFKMFPAPSRAHQEVLGALHLQIGNYLHGNIPAGYTLLHLMFAFRSRSTSKRRLRSIR